MADYLQNRIWELRRFAMMDDSLLVEFDQMMKTIKRMNKTNFRASIPISNRTSIMVRMEDDCLDYGLITGKYECEYGTVYSRLARDEKIRLMEEKLDKYRADLYSGSYLEDQKQIQEIIDSLEEELDAWENTEFNADVLSWQNLWNFNEEKIDPDLAAESGLIGIEYKGKEYLTIGTTFENQNALIQLTYYQACRFGCILKEFAEQIQGKRNLDKFIQVLGTIRFNKMIRAMKMDECFLIRG